MAAEALKTASILVVSAVGFRVSGADDGYDGYFSDGVIHTLGVLIQLPFFPHGNEDDDQITASKNHLVFAYYVTGHGFGHATRVVEVIRHLINATSYSGLSAVHCPKNIRD